MGELRPSLRAAVRTWRVTAERMAAILEDPTLSEAEMLRSLEREITECHRAMDTLDAELARIGGDSF